MSPCNDLTDLLREWSPGCDPGTGFNRGVWSRIEATECRRGAGISGLFGWIALLGQPRVAVGAALIALFGGVFLGNLQARSTQESRYLLSLNPYAQQR